MAIYIYVCIECENLYSNVKKIKTTTARAGLRHFEAWG